MGSKLNLPLTKKEYTRVVTGFILDIHDDMVEKKIEQSPFNNKVMLEKR